MLNNFSRLWIIVAVLISLGAVILGIVIFSLNKKPPIKPPESVQTIKPSPPSLETFLQNPNDQTLWQSYTDEKKRYSIKYSPVFQVKSKTEGSLDSTQFVLSDEAGGEISINWQKLDKKLSLSDFVDAYMKNYENFEILDKKSSTTSPPLSLPFISINTNGPLFVFIQKDQENIINLSVTNPAGEDSLRDIFDQMLTTFEFLQ